MKLIIQIPCFNEAETLGVTLSVLPRDVVGFDKVEWLVIDDGSTDDTQKIAREQAVDHIVIHKKNQGLARAFLSGINECLVQEADVIVNIDGDNQYDAGGIPSIVQPILDGKADLVIGARPIDTIDHFSWTKRTLQKIGSWVVRRVSFTDVPDATSGFRALSREAGQQTVVFSEYTYTLETIIQAGHRKLSVFSVPVNVNEDVRPSRLVRSIPSYLKQSIITIVRIYVIYRPLHFFGSISIGLIFSGAILAARYLYFYWKGEGDGHVQSLIIMSVILITGFQVLMIGFVADLFSANRKLLEDIRLYLRKQNDRKE